MNETIGNQQATSHQLAWLAGIWDGEGTFSIYYSNNHYVGRLTLTNTSDSMINEIVKILDKSNIKGHLWYEEPRTNKHKACWHVTINKLNNVKTAIELMMPYLVNKKPNAEILLRFVLSRLKYQRKPIKDEKTGRIIGMSGNSYTEEEKTFYEQIRRLNKTGQ